jgi:hypothetical protein
MALTTDIIKASTDLATLTDVQIAAITTLSVNDESNVISSKIGELHGRYDQDVKEVTGIEKLQSEKTYDYVKRVLTDYKTKAVSPGETQAKIAGYEAELTKLNKQITEGKGDEVIRQQLKDAQTELNSVKNQYDADKVNWGAKEKDFSTQITSIQVDTQFEKALTGVKFKTGYPEGIQQTLLSSAKNAVLGQYKPDWVETDGKKTMVFRDSKGEILRNRANALNPYTAKELISEQLKDVLDTGSFKTGAGTSQGTDRQGGSVDLIDLAGAKTQIEADNLIVKYLLQSGETRGNIAFIEKQKKLRTDNNVGTLPLR